MKKTALSILRLLLIVIGFLLLAFILLLVFLSVTEYKPEEVEPLSINGQAEETVHPGDTIKVLSWNIGYGALGDNADFFMDGGSSVNTADLNRVNENMAAITSFIKEENADLILLQETDISSSRSHKIDESALILDAVSQNGSYTSTFANNFKVAFIPYPIPPIGKVDSGLYSLSRYPVLDASRIKLPNPFSWPIRMANLKRCLSVMRIPVEGTGKELVVVNLHLEAYDSGEGKIAQTNMLNNFLTEEANKGNYVIAAGDFNQTFSNVDTSAYPVQEDKWHCGSIDAADFDDHLILAMDERVPTCRSLDQSYADYADDPATFQYYMIDGMIFSDNINIRTLKTEDLHFKASDHNPVIAEVELLK